MMHSIVSKIPYVPAGPPPGGPSEINMLDVHYDAIQTGSGTKNISFDTGTADADRQLWVLLTYTRGVASARAATVTWDGNNLGQVDIPTGNTVRFLETGEMVSKYHYFNSFRIPKAWDVGGTLTFAMSHSGTVEEIGALLFETKNTDDTVTDPAPDQWAHWAWGYNDANDGAFTRDVPANGVVAQLGTRYTTLATVGMSDQQTGGDGSNYVWAVGRFTTAQTGISISVSRSGSTIMKKHMIAILAES